MNTLPKSAIDGLPTRLGSGWLSGVVGIFAGALGLGGVLCLLFPNIFTTPELRNIYPVPVMRALIHFFIVGGFVCATISIVLRRNKLFGFTGLLLSLAAVLLGGAEVPVGVVSGSNYLGLDWFLLNVLLLALIFIPLERVFARLKDQGIFRQGWETDLAHFFVSHLLVQVSVFLTLLPARVFFTWAINADLQKWVASLPFVAQFVGIVFVADFSEYWIHRAMHQVPWLWRIHAVHHSCEKMDWLAASRLHLLDIVVVRALTFVPLYVMGFANGPVFAYLVFVSFHAIFIHANVNFRFGWLDNVIATPRFHHWHHAAEREAIDKNFAVHLPLLDRLFGTCLLPREQRWPAAYGIKGHPVPEKYSAHLLYPFRGKRK